MTRWVIKENDLGSYVFMTIEGQDPIFLGSIKSGTHNALIDIGEYLRQGDIVETDEGIGIVQGRQTINN